MKIAFYSILSFLATFVIFTSSGFTSWQTLLLMAVGTLSLSQLFPDNAPFDSINAYSKFAYNCFLKPVFFQVIKSIRGGSAESSGDDHRALLEEFYEGQASIYDETRQKLLQGRSSMLRLCASQLRQGYAKNWDLQPGDQDDRAALSADIPSPPPSPYLRPRLSQFESTVNKKVVWIDLGGGTGWNIQEMNKYLPLSQFHSIYLVDITPSLCNIAKNRFSELGWDNVKVLCMDALNFNIRDFESDEDVEIGLITMSYSLSMMPSPFGIVDKVYELLEKSDGRAIFGVADFFVSGKHPVNHDPTRHHSFLTRWFWSMWFETDNVYLNHLRREYVEHKFVTVKQLNCRNWVIRKVIGMPYYIFIGTVPMKQSVKLIDECTEHKLDSNLVSDEKNLSSEGNQVLQKNESVNKKALSIEHVHGQGLQWRQSFDPLGIPGIDTYIYAFAWEDPKVDLEFLNLKSDDEMLVLTSGGCNALEYAIHGPARIHCVDMNPCQGHMLELKIAALTSLSYEDFWNLLGKGCHPAFDEILDTRLAPYLSPYAYQFWKESVGKNPRKLARKEMKLYETGFSGLAIRAFKHLARVKRLSGRIKSLCEAETLEEQKKIWYETVRPHFLDPRWIKLLNNERFVWRALGVPKEQFKMLLDEGGAYQYIANTFDPLIDKHLLSQDSYFYRLCLTQSYASNEPGNCPSYLTVDGFKKLKYSKNLQAIKIHTKSIADVLKNELPEEPTLTKAIVMDHQDWFTEEQADEEIFLLSKKMKTPGMVLIRSAAKIPWYLPIYRKHKFQVRPLGIRMSNEEKSSGKWSNIVQKYGGKCLIDPCIDRVNMYASFWMAEKL